MTTSEQQLYQKRTIYFCLICKYLVNNTLKDGIFFMQDAIGQLYYSLLMPQIMYKNYLVAAFRTLARNKAFSFINILGLALGMACSLLILLWVRDERNIDNFHKNAPYLYDVYERVFSEGKLETAYWTPGQ